MPCVIRTATSVFVAALLVVPAAAHAHAQLDRADPKVGSTVSAPNEVRIWFDSDLDPASSSVAIRGPGGATVGDGHGAVDPSDTRLLKSTLPHLSPGTYHVTWTAVSRDGHRTSGSYSFTVK